MTDFLLALTPAEAFILVAVLSLPFAAWTRPRCHHQWVPVYHSYRCELCDKIDREY